MQPLTSVGYKRRKLLQLGLAIAGFGLTWSCSQEQSKSSTNKPKILVIGAGVSGLAAARELVRSGFEVTVLEGRDRIGGRINTDRSLGLPIDLGASWIHGIRGNPIGKLARELEVPILPTDYDNIEIYGKDGSLVSETEIERLYAIYEKTGYKLFSLAEELEADISIAEAVRRIGIPKNLTEREINILQQFLDSEIVIPSGADLDSLSLWYADDSEVFGGDDYLFPNGYDQIIQGLARGIDVKLEHKVIEIEYGDRNSSRVRSKVVAEDPPQTPPLRLRSGHAYKRGGKEAPLVKMLLANLTNHNYWVRLVKVFLAHLTVFGKPTGLPNCHNKNAF
ncbi:MAG: FAD-dependent oxidoreductase, partial [Oscillatoria sp. SIO1A7]|nr:FAD-dependent oxidoreductase [Oscillatoria sp. SIO1A7]